MEDYADIFYVDDNRNAREPRVYTAGDRRPYRPTRTVYWTPPGRLPAQPTTAPMIYPQQPFFAPQAQLMYPGFPPQSTAAALFGKLTTGQIVEMVALQSLPGAPVATRDTSTDVANLILFQSALAQHAKRDEQVRTLGSLVAKLVG